MKIKKQILYLLCFSLSSLYAADKKEDEFSEAFKPPMNKVFVYVSDKPAKGEDKAKYSPGGALRGFCRGNFCGLKGDVIEDPDEALPEQAGLFIKIAPEAIIRKRSNRNNFIVSYSYITSKYKLYISKKGKWKSVGSGKVSYIGHTNPAQIFAGIIYKGLLPLKIKKTKNIQGGKAQVTAYIQNNSNLPLTAITINATAGAACPYLPSQGVNATIDLIEPGQKKKFTVQGPMRFDSEIGKLALFWDKAFVSSAKFADMGKSK